MQTPAPSLRPVIFDVGLHHGEDTDFYLKKGFDVVAVEADPRHVEKATIRFADAIAEGRLEIVSAAIAEAAGQISFYVNLDKDDWSSTELRYGARANTRHEVITVPAITFDSLYNRVLSSGLGGEGARTAHYVKCDIEGGDVHLLRSLRHCKALPKYVSVEMHSFECLAQLCVLGYTEFKMVNQNLNWTQKLPNPPMEGEFVEHAFTGHSSGPFGNEAPGNWMDVEDAGFLYLTMRDAAKRFPWTTNGWFDVHAAIRHYSNRQIDYKYLVYP